MDLKSTLKKVTGMGYQVEIVSKPDSIKVSVTKTHRFIKRINSKIILWEEPIPIEKAILILVDQTETLFNSGINDDGYEYHHKGLWDRVKPKLEPNVIGKPIITSTPIGPTQEAFNKFGEEVNKVGERFCEAISRSLNKEREWYEERGGLRSRVVEEKPFEEYPTGCQPESHNQAVRELGTCYLCGRDWFI